MSEAGPSLAFARHAALILQTRSSPDTVSEIISRLGLPDLLSAPVDTQISVHDEAAFIEEACQAAGNLDFGFECGLSFGTAATLPVYLARHAPTLREGIGLAIRYMKTARPGLEFELVESGNAAILRLHLSDPRLAAATRHREVLFAGMTAQTREFTKRPFHPDRISFTHDRTPVSQKVRARFGCAVEFGAEHTEMQLSPAILDAPMIARDDILEAVLLAQADAEMSRLDHPEPKLAEKVELLLDAAFPDQVPSLKEVAKSLGLSSRTLSRRLGEAGTSFQGIRNHVRMRIAARELRDTGTPIGEIAWRLGYSGQAAFSTAFRRETGQSPREYRQIAGEE